MQFLSWIDIVALSFFIFGWLAYSKVLSSERYKRRSIANVMARYRTQWMQVMATRDPRMLDSMLQASLMQGVGFLASTAVLMVGVLTAMLGYSENALDVTLHLPQSLVMATANWKL
ncbi:MAG: DUF599 family protein, partial [Granulosicoccaceae bacterium]